MGSFSAIHWLIVAVVVLLLFGPSRLANAGKGLGEGIRNFKKGLDADDPTPPKDAPPAAPTQLAPPQDNGQKP
ncbi:MAG: twin-arginine translocase TatA/TatE family subunit [Polyangiaceae bacterium]|nr:twin-arginine translocase TatA/TatE family subunit [Polyangiaceae bacterium]